MSAEHFSVYATLDLSKYESGIVQDEAIVFTADSNHNSAKISSQKNVALAKKHPDKFKYIGSAQKQIGKTRNEAHPQQALFVFQKSRSSWERGLR